MTRQLDVRASDSTQQPFSTWRKDSAMVSVAGRELKKSMAPLDGNLVNRPAGRRR